jgi:hypothetical protein
VPTHKPPWGFGVSNPKTPRGGALENFLGSRLPNLSKGLEEKTPKKPGKRKK